MQTEISGETLRSLCHCFAEEVLGASVTRGSTPSSPGPWDKAL